MQISQIICPQAGCLVPPFIWSSSYATFLQRSDLQSAFILIILFHTQTYLLKAFPDFLGQEAGDQNDELFSVQTSQSQAELDLNQEWWWLHIRCTLPRIIALCHPDFLLSVRSDGFYLSADFLLALVAVDPTS